MKYEEAIKELENIVSQIEKNELDIDQLTERLKVAQQLIKQCRDKLHKTDEEIKAMLEE
ncbi:MAG: exodeoxyribonuclease VII small subunit [Bacteroidaceae bacterium]|nr:exodeoxyribonuclease VII small subunit [Bacteroidaceae bacterium]